MFATTHSTVANQVVPFSQGNSTLPQQQPQLIATWVIENNRLVCRWTKPESSTIEKKAA